MQCAVDGLAKPSRGKPGIGSGFINGDNPAHFQRFEGLDLGWLINYQHHVLQIIEDRRRQWSRERHQIFPALKLFAFFSKDQTVTQRTLITFITPMLTR